ncbi:MAG: hypothetical protein WC796_04865 [Candidatus Pacearchaeota archaeon]|jgi:hypothetical protein
MTLISQVKVTIKPIPRKGSLAEYLTARELEIFLSSTKDPEQRRSRESRIKSILDEEREAIEEAAEKRKITVYPEYPTLEPKKYDLGILCENLQIYPNTSGYKKAQLN